MAKAKKQPSRPADDPPTAIHGPAGGRPLAAFGREHLRSVLHLSEATDIDRLCEDAALEIAELRGSKVDRTAFDPDSDYDS